MNVSTARREAEASAHPCANCGCEDCKQECCTLDCLERPRFYCGQVLNDRDLNALTDWVREKTGLSRYRHGWGVVCGLGVSCGPECGSITISPGYAISCCGDDIVICEPATQDLCCYIPKQPGGCEGGTPAGNNNEKDERFSWGSYDVLKRDVFVFDVYIQYEGVLTSPQPAVSRDACGTTSTCEYSRIKEGYRLCLREATDCQTEEPWTDAASNYTDFVQGVIRPLDYSSLEDTQKRLLKLVDEWGQHQHCCIRNWICSPPQDVVGDTWTDWAVPIWERLVLDRLESYFSCDCFDCEDTWGVPLARVWLHRQRPGKCCVLRIAVHSPFRRKLSLQCWPAAPGYVHLGQYVGQNLDDVECALLARAIRVTGEEVTFDAGQFTGVSAYAPCDSAVTAIWYSDECEIKRVVAFRQGATTTPPIGVPVIPGEDQTPGEDVTPDENETPISAMTSMDQRFADNLAANNVKTVEQLARLAAEKVQALAGTETERPPKRDVNKWLAEAANILKEKSGGQ